MLFDCDNTRQHFFDFMEHRVKDYHHRDTRRNPNLVKFLAAIAMRKPGFPPIPDAIPIGMRPSNPFCRRFVKFSAGVGASNRPNSAP
jgi:hypothetical protein